MNKIFILKRELPWAKAGTEWKLAEDVKTGSSRVCLRDPREGEPFWFPQRSFNDWFEEKKPTVTFTKEQMEAIKDKLEPCRVSHDGDWLPGAYSETHHSRFFIWLNEHTQK